MEPLRFRRMTRTSQRGFTIVELLVVLGIMVVVTSIVLSGQSSFNQSLLLTDTAYTVALSLREAQSLGISSRGIGGVYNVGYGLYFSSGAPSSYTVFADTAAVAGVPSHCPVLTTAAGTPEAKSGNCLYDNSSENFRSYSFTRGFRITEFCGKDLTGTRRCAGTGYLTALHILYLRPNTTAVISGINAGTPVQLTCAEISVSAPTGDNVTKIIRVNQLGEVSVGQTCP